MHSVLVKVGRFTGVLLERSGLLDALTDDRLPTPVLASRIFDFDARVAEAAEAMGLCI